MPDRDSPERGTVLTCLDAIIGTHPVDVLTATTIDRPIAEVAAYAGNPDNAPHWYENIASVRWRTQPPLGVGTQLDFVAHFLGRTFTYTYEVVEHGPDHLVMRTAHSPFPMETTQEPGCSLAGISLTR